MSSLINLISQYGKDTFILPILCLVSIVVTILIYLFLSDRKFTKYILGIILLVLAIIDGIYSYTIFTTPKGLVSAWIGVILASCGFVGVCTGFIIDIIDSIKRSYETYGKEDGKK